MFWKLGPKRSGLATVFLPTHKNINCPVIRSRSISRTRNRVTQKLCTCNRNDIGVEHALQATSEGCRMSLGMIQAWRVKCSKMTQMNVLVFLPLSWGSIVIARTSCPQVFQQILSGLPCLAALSVCKAKTKRRFSWVCLGLLSREREMPLRFFYGQGMYGVVCANKLLWLGCVQLIHSQRDRSPH